MLDEHRFGDHGTGAAGTGEPGDCRQQMNEKDGQIAHRAILARSRHAQKCRRLLEFAIAHAPFLFASVRRRDFPLVFPPMWR